MRRTIQNIGRAALLAVLLLMLGLPALAFADEDPGPTDALDIVDVEQLALSPDPTTEPATGPAIEPGTDGPAVSGQTSLSSTRNVPRNAAPYEPGWSLVNLMAVVLTVLIGTALVFSSLLHQEGSGQTRSNFGLAVVSLLAAAAATVLFTSTEDIGSHMIAIDNFTVAHIVILAAAIFCAVLSVSRTAEDPEIG